LRDGAWPTRKVQVGAQRWSIQHQCGNPARPWLLLIHGTGSSAGTWRGMLPDLTRRFNLLAPDLPGHAGSAGTDGADLSLPGMARALRGLLADLQVEPALIVAHSAGAAIALRLVLDGLPGVRAVVGINSALLPPQGLSGRMFLPVARLLARRPWVPRLFAWHATNPAVARRMIEATGSKLDAAGVAHYQRLISDPAHAAGALAMMASWNLRSLAQELRHLTVPLHLIVATNDRTLPPAQSHEVLSRVPQGSLESLAGLGHLAHEEQPGLVLASVLRAARAAGLMQTA
jgi:magnesium chelatase accessory protein